jgi:hypothetical protein
MHTSVTSSPGTARRRGVLGLTIVCLAASLAGCGITVSRDFGTGQPDGSSDVVCGPAASGPGHALVCVRGRTLNISP